MTPDEQKTFDRLFITAMISGMMIGAGFTLLLGCLF